MKIEEIEKQIINLLPTSNILFDEVDYSILEERKKDWKKLSEVTHSIVLAFDCYSLRRPAARCQRRYAAPRQLRLRG